MLSYRHGFHAGNFADVLKHSILTLVVKALQKKDTPFVFIDTHAGAGKYSLTSEFAQKTREFEQGIAKIWQAENSPPEIQDYLSIIRLMNSGSQLKRYPGSPELVKHLIRKQDRIQLSELHGTDFAILEKNYRTAQTIEIKQEDGLKTLNKKLPPIQKRGLVFIDPSYELKADYDWVVDAVNSACHRFATGVYCLWYPVIDRTRVEKMLQKFIKTGIRRQLRIEHCVSADSSGTGMTGSGLIIINPPYQLDEQALQLLPWLNKVLTDESGSYSVEWWVPE